jgi:hypothetical protein
MPHSRQGAVGHDQSRGREGVPWRVSYVIDLLTRPVVLV